MEKIEFYFKAAVNIVKYNPTPSAIIFVFGVVVGGVLF